MAYLTSNRSISIGTKRRLIAFCRGRQIEVRFREVEGGCGYFVSCAPENYPSVVAAIDAIEDAPVRRARAPSATQIAA